MSSGKTIISAYGTSLLGIVSGLLTNLWLLKEITQVVDKESFGLYGLALQITGYLAVLQVGLDLAVSRQIAEALGRGDNAMANRALVGLKWFNRWAGLACLGLAVLITVALRFMVHGQARATLLSEIALFTGLTQTVFFWSRRSTAALIGSQFQALLNVVVVGTSIFTTMLAFALLKLGWGVLCLPVGGFLAQLASWAYLNRQCQTRCKWLNTSSPQLPDRNELRKLFTFGALSSLTGVGWTIEATCDVFILQAVGGPESVALYVLWWRFPQLAWTACTNLAASAFPSLAHKLASSREESVHLLAKVVWVQIGLATMAVVGFGIWLPGFVRLWVGSQYSLPQATAVGLAMGLLVCIRAYGNLLSTAWIALGNAKLLTIVSWIQAAVKVPLGVWWSYRFGLPGIILASCLSMCLSCVLFASLLHREGLLTRGLIWKGLSLSGVALIIALLVAGRFPAPSLLAFTCGTLVTALLWGALWLAIAWQGELGPPLRQLQMRWLARRQAAL